MAESEERKRYSKCFTFSDSLVTVKVGDCVLLKAECGEIPHVARIHEIYIKNGDISQDVHLKVKWFYKHQDTKMKPLSFIGTNELYKSEHFDDVLADSILGPCSVRSFYSYTQLKEADENVFFTRYTYDHVAQRLVDSKVDVFCRCKMPNNPDQLMVQCKSCKDWYHPACEPKAKNLAEGDELECTKCCKQD